MTYTIRISLSFLPLYSREIYLDDSLNAAPSGLEDGNDVLAACGCLVTNVSFYELAICTARNLA